MTPSTVILVGAGDHGRGVLEIVRRAGGMTVRGFVDDRAAGPGPHGQVDGVPILGDSAWLAANLAGLDSQVVLALADPTAKETISRRLDQAGARYATVIHPAAEVAASASLAPGTVINAGAVVVYDAVIGPHVTVNLGATIGHHVHLGACSTVAPGVHLLGKVHAGRNVQVHAGAVVLPGVKLGDGCTVGAGSVVLRDVAGGLTVFGNPARPVPRP